ncbi:butyrophilin-like protein 3 [Thomomys bottae]
MVLIFVLVLSLLSLASAQWQVIGPEKFLSVTRGEDVEFSCVLSPKTSAENMEVRFFKNQFDEVVHYYRDGKDQQDIMPEYRRRTMFVKDSLAQGRATLKLWKVTPSDIGLYGCWFSSQTHSQMAVWELQVMDLGTPPLISILEWADGGIQLSCHTSGWFSRPTVKWKSPQGSDIPSESKMKKDMHDLFHVESPLTIQKSSGIVSCSVQHPGQTKELESRVWIREMIFQSSPWLLVGILLMIFFCVTCVAVISVKILFIKIQGKKKAQLANLKETLDQQEKHRQTDTLGLSPHQASCSPGRHSTIYSLCLFSEWRMAKTHAVEVTLDPESAHPQLYITNITQLSSVICTDIPQEVDFSEKRFTRKCVVASQGFSEGKHYWEVDVGYNKRWYLGVCRDDVDRKRKDVTLSPDNGYWLLGLWGNKQYFTMQRQKVNLFPRTPPRRVGIFLNMEDATISFFNVNDRSLIFTLTIEFKGLLRPYIQLQMYGEERYNPIFICPVS